MRIDVDYDRCEGHGLCEDQAPEVFRLDDAGDLHLQHEEIPADQVAAVQSAVAACPVAALRERS
ncbi:ferredoxin [Rhodococcus kroppenstedtii]|jgi:ferredoxin|uniref:Ferredoxin n=1 Tax=Rhodococcoides kroppenstedtii TaxID=293050 RepID=A0A1I0TQ50_9NOCA|nr:MULTISPECIES: ferredoxin [Rhodococcus]AMY20269.1 Ferredoxin [Rhodococcus sp. PBTS 1]MBT1191238.1 ferredoxin [Rhodococcus kroppenstedtii]MBY6314921.1 ferredoxin [Rhodococcus kroppenstedtii]MBY6322657.1 ferredoxin [Rhodococcus kroppenstedtii]MBY6399957.1 ferredoxin [Rhodococcus kroppenstedtii]